jgi:hypothetical protein
MKTIYKGHEIEATREKSLGDDERIFLTITRLADDYLVEDISLDPETYVREVIKNAKVRVDNEIRESELEKKTKTSFVPHLPFEQ